MARTVFTNGCFDLIHPGHVDLLRRARAMGDRLVVGINSDASVKAIKGAGRPLLPQDDRAEILRGLRFVDEVIIYDELTPERVIKEVSPDVLIKGGDWPIDQIVGAQFVLDRGGSVHSLPLKDSYSTSNLISGIQGSSKTGNADLDETVAGVIPGDYIDSSLREHQHVFSELLGSGMDAIRECAREITNALSQGNKILICGNGGSAADAQHIAAELVGRYESERRAWPAIALTTDTSTLTAVSNDYGFDNVFSRQVSGLAAPGDVLIGISTSGNSPNVIAAVMTARGIGCRIVGLTGASGKRLASLCDAAVMVPSTRTARIQEAHITVGHIWCELVDKWIGEEAA